MEKFAEAEYLASMSDRLTSWLAANGLSLEGSLWIWTVTQILICAVAYLAAVFAARAMTPAMEERLRGLSGRPRLLRFLAIILRRLKWIWFTLLIWAGVIVMRSVTWPSRSYFITAVASLATAWLIISVVSRIIRNRLVANIVAIAAWAVAALNVFGLLDDTIQILDSLAFVLGEVRISALLVIKGLLTCSLLIWAAIGLSNFVDRGLSKNPDITPSVRVLVSKILRVFLFLVAILTGLNLVGFDLTALAVFSGALGLGIGFGLQKVVSNLFSGIILLMDKSIKPGDVIEIATVSGTTYGWVQYLGARYTSIRTRDGMDTLFPNETFITTPVTNWSHGNTRIRQKLSVGVAYDTDLEHAIELCIEAAREQDRILDYPEPICLVLGFADSSIDLQVRYWLEDPQAGLRNVASAVNLQIWRNFREHNIEIPFPQRDMRLRSSDPVPVRIERKVKASRPFSRMKWSFDRVFASAG